MGYKIVRMGSLYETGDPVSLVSNHAEFSSIQNYNDGVITMGDTAGNTESVITWIKPDNMNLLVADRVLLRGISWKNIAANKFLYGKKIRIDGCSYLCRLLRVGATMTEPNEWDEFLDAVGEDDALVHWADGYFWGQEILDCISTKMYGVIRGCSSARNWDKCFYSAQPVGVGFRPALQPLDPIDFPTGNKVCLDGQGFVITQANRNKNIFTLYPTMPNSEDFDPYMFDNIPNGTKCKMYTFLKDNKPVTLAECVGENVAITDKYFGDEFLIPWIISNGIAMVSDVL